VTGRRRYGYVYGGTVEYRGRVRDIHGDANCDERCDEVKLRAAAAHDVARAEGVPLAEIEIIDFWYSEMATNIPGTVDPFRPHGVADDHPDPFSPGHPCTGDA
jgi:hypothetical protein